MTFDPLATVQFHSKLALQASFHVPQEFQFHKNLKWFLEGNYCRIAERVLEPKSEWNWTVASGSKVIVAHRRMRSLRPRCQLEPKPVDFHESNKIKPKSLSPWASKHELDQNKTSSQNICTGLENIRVARLFARNNSAYLSAGFGCFWLLFWITLELRTL